MTYRPNIAAQMREIVNLDAVRPERWAHTYEAWGVTEDEVRHIRDEEMLKRIRNAEEAADE